MAELLDTLTTRELEMAIAFSEIGPDYEALALRLKVKRQSIAGSRSSVFRKLNLPASVKVVREQVLADALALRKEWVDKRMALAKASVDLPSLARHTEFAAQRVQKVREALHELELVQILRALPLAERELLAKNLRRVACMATSSAEIICPWAHGK